MLFNKEIWASVGANYVIYDCAIRNQDRHCFLMYERQAPGPRELLPRIQFLFTYCEEQDPSEQYYGSQFGHFGFSRIAFGEPRMATYVAVDTGGNVYSYDPDKDGEEDNHPIVLQGSELLGTVSNVVRIGDSIYTVGGARRMYKRIGHNKWKDMTASLPIPEAFTGGDVTTIMDYQWHSAHGLSESDIYAVGGAGDVWHFDSKKWKQLKFPSNEPLSNVWCAANGNVYIGGAWGSLYVGRENTWKKLHDSSMTVPWKDIAWFGETLWCGSDYGLWSLDGEKLIRAKVPADVQLSAGAIDVSPEGQHMLTAGPDGAAQFDGKAWTVLFNRHELEG